MIRLTIWFAVFAAAGFLTDFLLRIYLNKQSGPGTVIFSFLCCIAFLAVFDDPIRLAKGCIFSHSLIAAGYVDHKTSQIPDTLCTPIVICGLFPIGSLPSNWLPSLEGAIILFAVLLAFRLLFNGVGGGDIKLMTACGWALGLYGALTSAILSFSLFFLISLLKGKKLKDHCAVGPFIAVGSIAAFLLTT
jgi:leader peptidase (prepilin peptidase)/N-methyltransferase